MGASSILHIPIDSCHYVESLKQTEMALLAEQGLMIPLPLFQENSACAWWTWTERELLKNMATPFK